MPGGKPWHQRGTGGSGETVAVTERPEIATIDATQTGSVTAGTTETVEIYAPTGAVYRPVALNINIVADATWTTGDHYVIVRTAGDLNAMLGKSTYAADVRFQYGEWETDDSGQPATSAGQQAVLSNLKATEKSPIKLRYKNNGDAAQDNDRKYSFSFEEVSY